MAEINQNINIVDVLTAAGLDVEAQAGWATRGSPDFAPVGIMLHHTAGPKSWDAPSLSLVTNGRPGLSGPLCNILVGRSGKVHVVAH